MIKLATEYSPFYPNYEFTGLKFVVRDFSLQFYADCKKLEREFNRVIIRDNYSAHKDIIEISDSFNKIFNNLPIENYEDVANDPDLFLKAKEKIIDNMINNKADTENIYMVLMQQGIDFDSTKEIFLCGSSVIDDVIIPNIKLVLKTFTNSESFDKIEYNSTDVDYGFELVEFAKTIFNDFFLFMQKSKNSSVKSLKKISESTN